MDSLYKNDKRIEVLELKEELKEHLILSVEEFIAKGYSEEEAAQKAIEKFDGGKEMLDELRKTLKKNKSKSYIACKLFRNISIISFILVVLLIGYSYMAEKHAIKFGEKFDKDFKVLASKHGMTKVKEFKEDLRLLLDKKEYDNVKDLEIFVTEMKEGNKNLDVDIKSSKLVYEIVDPKVGPGMKSASNSLCVFSKDVLDKHGNVVHPQIYIDATILNFIWDYIGYIIWVPIITFAIYCIFKIKLIIDKRRYA